LADHPPLAPAPLESWEVEDVALHRTRTDSREARAWRQFAAANRELVARAGIPQSVCESLDLFIDLLENAHRH